jgi:Dolichyl-phosphate-mannose-protein mannosyltransferase
MSWSRASCVPHLFWLGLMLAGIGLRLWQLDIVPEPDGDEAFYGIQSYRLAHGKASTLVTSSGNLIDPFIPLIQVPLSRIGGPSTLMLRLPCALSGVFTVCLVYFAGRRVLDEPTARIAAVVFAVLPIAIIFNRSGCEYGQTPLFAMILLLCALAGRGYATVLAYIACLLVHPTTLFLAPIAVPVLLVQRARRISESPSRRWRELAAMIVFWGLLLGGYALHTKSRSASSAYYTVLYRPMSWSVFLRGFGGFVTGVNAYAQPPWNDARWSGVIAWMGTLGVVGLLAAGIRRFYVERRWECMALVCGLFASVIGLHVQAGSAVWRLETQRYGSYLIAPLALAIACAARGSLVPSPARGKWPAAICVRHGAGLAAAVMLLAGLKLHYFDCAIPNDGHARWALARDSKGMGAMEGAVEAIERDIPLWPVSSGGRARLVIAGDWWVRRPIEYLSLGHGTLTLCEYDSLVAPPERRPRLVLEQVVAGNYCAGFFNSDLDQVVRTSFPPRCLQRMVVLDCSGRPRISVTRLRREISVPGDYDGDGRLDSATYRFETAGWSIRTRDSRLDERQFGTPGADLPVPGDYDGDGVTDLAVYNSKTGVWRIQFAAGTERSLAFPVPGVGIAVPGDYNGDGACEPAVYRRDTGDWLFPSGGWGGAVVRFGTPGVDLPVPADYDGDGVTDLAVYRASTAQWSLMRSTAGPLQQTFGVRFFGEPAPADYDGDGRADLAVYRSDERSLSVQRSRELGAAAQISGRSAGGDPTRR